MMQKKEEISNAITMDIMTLADVVCATCIGCGSDAFLTSKQLQFSLIIIDEARYR